MRSLHKKLFRAIREGWGQSLAVVMVVGSGIANYICLNSAYLDLSQTRDNYYRQERLADFELILERAPAASNFRLEDLPGVRQVRGRIIGEANLDIEGIDEPRTGRIVSMPPTHTPVINDIIMRSGKYFDEGAEDQVILSEKFATSNHIALGDRIDVTVKSKRYALRVVGTAISPEFVYLIRNVQELIPAPERFGVLWVPTAFAESCMDMKGSCNSFLGTLDNPDTAPAVLDAAEKLMKPFGVHAKVTRLDMISNRFLKDELHGLSVSARVVPVIFMSIAALILFVLLNRMVRNERTQIGLMKAYGYSDFAVAIHYIQYALILTLGGTIIGFVGGQLLSKLLVEALYAEFYIFPNLRAHVYSEVVFKSTAIAAAAAIAGAVFAAAQAAAIHPAEAMRPEPPRTAHRIFLEAIPGLWRQISFICKMILRNIMRNRTRAAITAFGVSVSTALLLLAFFMLDALNYGLDFQFRRVQREDVRVSFVLEKGRDALYELAQLPGVRRAEPMLQYPFEVKAGWRKKELVVIGTRSTSEMQNLMDFKLRDVVLPPEGLVITDFLAKELGVQPGDVVTLKPLMGKVSKEQPVIIGQITEQFLGNSGYMDIDALSRLLGEGEVMNTALLRIEPEAAAFIKKELKDVPGIAAVGFKEDAFASLRNTIGRNIRVQNWMVLFFAGVIACSVIYNVTAVSLAERQRELASLRVLGLSAQEVGGIIYNENFVLSVCGIILGIPMGRALCAGIVTAYSNDLFRLPFYIQPKSYALAAIFTVFFVIIANLLVRRRIQSLDLVEVLKERD